MVNKEFFKIVFLVQHAQDIFANKTDNIYQSRIYDKVTMSADEQFTKLFQEEKYKEALTLLQEQYISIPPEKQHKILERQGFCYWQLGDFNKALTTFQTLELDTFLKEEYNPAWYYQALTFYKMGAHEQCKDLLVRIVELPDYVYKEEANRLLKEME